MNKPNIKTIIIVILYGLAIAILYLYFGESLLVKLNIKEPIKYPLAGVDILSEVKQEQAFTITSGQIQIDAQNINYSAIKPLPTEANIYEYENSKIARPENQKTLIASFGLGQNDQQTYTDQIIGKQISVAGQKSSLRIYEDLGMISYSQNMITNEKTFPNILDTEPYKQAGERFISSKGIDITNFIYSGTKYYSADSNDAEEVSSSVRAHILEFSYRAKITDLPIIDNNTDTQGNLLRVWLDVDQNILKMDYNEIGTIKNTVGSFRLKNKQQVASDIQNGRVRLVDSDTPIGDKITASSLREISLGYYVVHGFLVPVYIFQASSDTINQQKGTSYFIMEAVAE